MEVSNGKNKWVLQTWFGNLTWNFSFIAVDAFYLLGRQYICYKKVFIKKSTWFGKQKFTNEKNYLEVIYTYLKWTQCPKELDNYYKVLPFVGEGKMKLVAMLEIKKSM